jgi:protein-tyrosine sulfotransferase
MTLGRVSAEGAIRDPVFVICHGRSGSTLLRFLLDAHPELACPPETNLPALCAQLATVWSLIEGAPLSANRGDEPPDIPDAAITGIRQVMDLMVGSYLVRKGKQRYCDKSLGTARFAELLVRVYPQTKFICMYRHPMDVIASGIEACPWGLKGFGFEPFAAETPGNAVLALARFWVGNATMILALEDRFPDRCHRVRYEDLVADPEEAASQIFSFLGASPARGISTACFSAERERYGPADYKIWCTSRITDASVGRGWSIPASLILPPVVAEVNELAGKLGYLPVHDGWGASAPPDDLRVTHASAAAPSPGDARPEEDSSLPVVAVARTAQVAGETGSGRVGERLRAGLALVTPELRSKWGQQASESFVAVVLPGRTGNSAQHWLVDLRVGTVSPASQEAQDKSDWDMIGLADAWERVIGHDLNLNVALRSWQLRYCDETNAGVVVAEARTSILAFLLGLAAW